MFHCLVCSIGKKSIWIYRIFTFIGLKALYLKLDFSEKHCQVMGSSGINAELVGSWSVIVGDQDQVFHVWRYIGGYAEIDKARVIFSNSNVSFNFAFQLFLCIKIDFYFRNIVAYGMSKGSAFALDIFNMF